MKLSSSFNLFRILKMGSVRLLRIITMPVYLAYRKTLRFLNPQGIVNRILADVRKGFRGLMAQKPTSLDDYVAFPKHYVAKKLLYMILIGILVFGIIFAKFISPLIVKSFFTKEMYYNSVIRQSYSGKVRLLSSSDNSIVYEGKIDNGRITGKGKLFDGQKNLVYDGSFLMEMYDGEGETFYPNGKTQYKGSFTKNKYDGAGSLFDEEGKLIYEGQFQSGLYSGIGKQLYPNGQIYFEGEFKNGKPNGKGTIFSPDGKSVYEGELKEGTFDGDGIVFSDGIKFYEGSLKNGKMNGSGTLFKNGMTVYEGGFAEDLYSGMGKEFFENSDKLLYEGEFLNGKYFGKGSLYNENSDLLYQGDFKNGIFSGSGKLFNDDGMLYFDGDFANGKFEGQGKLFKQGSLVYEGQFYNNTYDGVGKIFDSLTKRLVYEGEFKNGMYSGNGKLYDSLNGALLYEGQFGMGVFNGMGILYDTVTGEIQQSGMFSDGSYSENTLVVNGVGDGTGTVMGGYAGGSYAPGAPTLGADASQNSSLQQAGGEGEKKSILSVSAFDDLKNITSAKPQTITTDGKKLYIYSDLQSGIGITVHSGENDKISKIDVWNDMSVSGVKNGMTKEEFTSLLGEPIGEVEETLGAQRLISISKANKFLNRVTNLSAASSVKVVMFQTQNAILNAVFCEFSNGAVIMEIIP